MLCGMKMIRPQYYAPAQGSVVRLLGLLALALTCCASPLNSPILRFPDQVRLRHLYADNEHQHLHLQITQEGEVSGTLDQNLYSLLEIKAIKPSVLVIRGMKSTRYLCMDSRHHLYGSMVYKEDDCNFREVSLPDGYNLYYSEKHPAPLTLKPTRGGHQSGKQMVRFMPLESTIPLESLYDDSFHHRPGSYLNIEDPLGLIDKSNIFSPSMDS